MACRACQLRGKTWEGDDPICAFRDGSFEPNNWNCATVELIRTVAAASGFRESRPINTATVLCDDEDRHAILAVRRSAVDADALYVSWYKEKGATQVMLLLDHAGLQSRRPTEDDCLKVVRYFSHLNPELAEELDQLGWGWRSVSPS